MKQSILLFESLYPQKTGGMEVYNYHLANSLLDCDDDSVIMLTSMKDRVDNKSTYYINSRLFGVTRWGLAYLSIFVYCLFSVSISFRKWGTVMIPYTSNFDLNAWPIILFSKIFRFKYSIHCHGGSIKEWKYPKLQKCLFKNASHVAAVSDSIVKEYSKRVGFDIEFLPPLVKFSKSQTSKEYLLEKYNLKGFDKIVLYVGSIKPLKSPDTLLQGFKNIDSKIKEQVNAVLVFAGDGSLRTELQNKYQSETNIVFLGNIPNENIHELFFIADIYVLCSWFEGTSVSLLEAMYNKCCCIGTDVQGINNIIANGMNGFLIPKEGIAEMTAALSITLTNDELAISLGNAAYEYYIKNFSYDKHLNNISHFLDK